MDQQLFRIFANWFPMLLLIAVWVFFLMRMRRGGGYWRYQAEQLEQMKRQTALLERIAAAVESRF